MDLRKLFSATKINKEDILKDLEKIIAWQEILETINTDNVKPIFNTLENIEKYIYNKDEINQKNIIDEILINAPEKYDNFFVVPKILNNE